MQKPQEYATKHAKIVDRFAAVLAETAAVKGDAATIDDYQALVELMDIVNDIDPEAIERVGNAQKKRLTRPRRPS